jgi:Subtilase family
MSRVLAAVVWTDASDLEALPPDVSLVESLPPLPIDLVTCDADALAALREARSVRSVSVPLSEEVAIVRGVAAILSKMDSLTLTAPNGYPGRMPADVANGTPAYPTVSADPRYLTDTDDQVVRITPQCHPIVLNLSLGPPEGLSDELAEDEPLAVATRQASELVLVVVAIGNNGQAEQADTRSALAKLPWTLAVAATVDAQGSQLDPRSSTGPPGGPGPFVSAFGESVHERPRTGTSFAASAVTYELAVLAGFFLTLVHAIHAPDVVGVPLCGIGIVDERPALKPGDVVPISAYPVMAGIDSERVKGVSEALSVRGVEVDSNVTPSVVKQALKCSARPIGGTNRGQTGHGFVSEATTAQYLRRFNGLEYARLFARPDAELDESDQRLTTSIAGSNLSQACQIWRRGALQILWDYTSNAGHLE